MAERHATLGDSTRPAAPRPDRIAGGVRILAAMAALLSASTASAQIVRPIGPAAPPTTVGSAVPTPGIALISGKAVDAGATPLPRAALRLRNLRSNLIEKQIVANPDGSFTFVVRPDLPYVVEVADGVGRVVAVSDVVVAQAGDVAAAVVEVPIHAVAATGVFADTAGSVISAASGIGVTVVEAAVLPLVSPER